jgi:cbb3-type cytochrome oxidase maturation protein
MTIIILLIGISLCIAVLFLAIFLWNMRSGQYEDTYTPSVRMLFEDKVDPKDRLNNKSEDLDKNQVSS